MRALAAGMWVTACALAACIEPAQVSCGDGVVCPGGTVCVSVENTWTCATRAQLGACEGVEDTSPCSGLVGVCSAGVCLEGCGDGAQGAAEECDCGTAANPACDGLANGDAGAPCSATCKLRYCGNAVVDPGEACDDGNFDNADSCALDCKSNVTCGNGYVDAAIGEICDDANTIDRDGCSSTCALEALQWTAWPNPWQPRSGHAAAFDSLGDRLVVTTGGTGSATTLSDTWFRDAAYDWTHSTAGPTAREGARMAFDENRGVAVLFGGLSGGYLADTWELAGTTWTKKTPTTSPPARTAFGMAYDPVRERVVLYGGLVGTTPFGDTWEYDGTTWTPFTAGTQPTPSAELDMAYDVVRSKLVLYLWTGSAMETWERTGTTWAKVSPNGAVPVTRYGYSMAYSTSRSKVVLFGGNSPTGEALSDTWEYDGTWTRIDTPATPIARLHATLTRRDDRLVLIGGENTQLGGNLDDQWEYTSAGLWQQIVFQFAPTARIGEIAFDEARNEVVMFGGYPAASETWLFDGAAWMKRTPSGSPSARYFQRMTYDPDRSVVLMFGGTTDHTQHTALAETWEWTGTAWSEKLPAASPSARYDMALAYNAAEHVAVLFGGHAANGTLLADTWEWDGTTWTPYAGGTHPAAASQSAMGYDPQRGAIVLVQGGKTWLYRAHAWTTLATVAPPTSTYNVVMYDDARARIVMYNVSTRELWELDGAGTWARLAISGFLPPPRFRASMVRDPVSDRFILYGNQTNGSLLGDTWILQYR